ncbi:MAG: glycosyltransferase [Verrucomicrobiae bacterium]|nr:glycosyltransferase [Verrucomicrobiae bacterium]
MKKFSFSAVQAGNLLRFRLFFLPSRGKDEGMRSLIIGHAYMAQDNCAKWRCLARRGGVEMDIHLPHRWPSWEGVYRARAEKSPRLRIQPIRAIRTGREDQYFFAPRFLRSAERRDFDILHVEQGAAAFVYTQALWEYALDAKRPKTCFFTWINWESPARWPWRLTQQFNFRHSDGAIGGNKAAVDILRRHGFKGRTEVIPQLGVDEQFYSPGPGGELRERMGLEGTVIGFVGRLTHEKGVMMLLEAAESFAGKATLLLLGTGELEKDILRWREQHRLRVIHVPAVSHDEVRDYLRAMDMLVLPSYDTPLWREQFGHVLIEAMACEVPVAGSSAGAIPEVIGEAGLVFPEKSAPALREALETLIQHPSERVRLGGLGRRRVVENFTHEKIAQRTLEFWRSL